MRLYPRKLHSIAELRKEKHMLRKTLKHAEKEGIFSSGQDASREKKNTSQQGSDNDLADYIGIFTDVLGARSIIDGMLAALPLATRLLPDEKVKKVLWNAVKEFGGGYLKWKALETGYRFIRRYFINRKTTKETEKEKQR